MREVTPLLLMSLMPLAGCAVPYASPPLDVLLTPKPPKPPVPDLLEYEQAVSPEPWSSPPQPMTPHKHEPHGHAFPAI